METINGNLMASIVFFKRDKNPFLNYRAIGKFNGVHVNECNRYALNFIQYQLISISETAKEEHAASVLER